MSATSQMTTRDAELVRGGSDEDVTRLLALGGRIVRRGNALHIRELDGATQATLQVRYVLVSFSHRRILVLLHAEDPPEISERRRVVHHLP